MNQNYFLSDQQKNNKYIWCSAKKNKNKKTKKEKVGLRIVLEIIQLL